jgi:hypothetical protein
LPLPLQVRVFWGGGGGKLRCLGILLRLRLQKEDAAI